MVLHRQPQAHNRDFVWYLHYCIPAMQGAQQDLVFKSHGNRAWPRRRQGVYTQDTTTQIWDRDNPNCLAAQIVDPDKLNSAPPTSARTNNQPQK